MANASIADASGHREDRRRDFEYVVEVVTRTLRDKFDWPENRLDQVREIMSKVARLVTPSQTLDVVKEDPADNRILECAVAAGSEYIATGDKDLHRLGRYESVRIVKVSELLKITKS